RWNVRNLPLVRLQPAVRIEGRLKQGLEAIIIRLRDRLVFLIMALGASKSQAEEIDGKSLHRLVQNAKTDVPRVQLIFLSVVSGHAQKARGDQVLPNLRSETLGGTPINQLIACNLLQ